MIRIFSISNVGNFPVEKISNNGRNIKSGGRNGPLNKF